MDLNSLIISETASSSAKINGPFYANHFTKSWDNIPGFESYKEVTTEGQQEQDDNEDVFFDAFSNSLILFKTGKFSIVDMHDEKFNQGVYPFQIHLAVQ